MEGEPRMTDLQPIIDKILAGQRIGADEGLRLYESADLHTLGELANCVRERLHGRRTFYNINRHINYTNYCVLRCSFCSFCRAKRGQKPFLGDHHQYRGQHGEQCDIGAGQGDRGSEKASDPISDGYELSIV